MTPTPTTDQNATPSLATGPRTPKGRHAGAPDLIRRGHNDVGNADRLIAAYGANLRYCNSMKKWLVWDGARWAADEKQKARKLAKLTILSFLKQALSVTK